MDATRKGFEFLMFKRQCRQDSSKGIDKTVILGKIQENK
jgi:hypothetical protein